MKAAASALRLAKHPAAEDRAAFHLVISGNPYTTGAADVLGV
jgi:hypothetical protein